MNKLFCLLVLLLPVITGAARTVKMKPVRVMSFNIRMDTEEDGENRWSNRKDFACRMVSFHAPDLMGCQEVLHHQLLDMRQRLPEYNTVGAGREDGKEKGEYSAVFYKKDRFDLLESSTFWLSENPAAVGKKGWDAACERVVTWVKLKDKKTKRVFFFFNTHFDHRGQVARHESALLLKSKITEIAGKYPVIVAGDFNAEPTSEVVRLLLDPAAPDRLGDARKVAGFCYGPEYSYHDYGRRPVKERDVIDYVFIKNISKVLTSAIITDTQGDLFVSDHYPVLTVLEI